MSRDKLSTRGRRIVAALGQFADDLEAGVPIGRKHVARQVGVIAPAATTTGPAG